MPETTNQARDRQIIGVSLPPEIAAQVKQEAARRRVSVRQLFLDMWAAYRAPDAE